MILIDEKRSNEIMHLQKISTKISVAPVLMMSRILHFEKILILYHFQHQWLRIIFFLLPYTYVKTLCKTVTRHERILFLLNRRYVNDCLILSKGNVVVR